MIAAALRSAIEKIPTREERLGGQMFKYVKLSEVLDLLDTFRNTHETLEPRGAALADAFKAGWIKAAEHADDRRLILWAENDDATYDLGCSIYQSLREIAIRELLVKLSKVGSAGCAECAHLAAGHEAALRADGRPDLLPHISGFGAPKCAAHALKAKLGETLPDTLVRWMSHDTWRCRCKSPGDINIKLCNYCGGCGTHRPEKSEPE